MGFSNLRKNSMKLVIDIRNFKLILEGILVAEVVFYQFLLLSLLLVSFFINNLVFGFKDKKISILNIYNIFICLLHYFYFK